MTQATPSQPDLAQRVVRLEALLTQSQAQVQALVAENQLLRQKLDALIRRYFGHTKNEGLDSAQLELLLLGLTAKVATPEPPAKTTTATPRTHSPRPAPRSGIPEDLPTVREVLLPEEVKTNPEAFRQIDELVTKELDWEAAKFHWRHIVRPKFVRKDSAAVPSPAIQKATPATQELATPVRIDALEVLVAPLPPRLIEKGLPGVGLLVHLLLSRFEDHLPFYRLEKIFRERHGVPLTRQSMVDWTEQLATWLQPIYRQMIVELFAGGYLQADETPMRYLDREEPGRSCRGTCGSLDGLGAM